MSKDGESETPGLALSAMATALRELRPKLGEEDYGKLRAIMCGGSVVLHRGETVMTLVRDHARRICEALPEASARMFLEGDFSEEDWRRAFAAVDAVGKATMTRAEAEAALSAMGLDAQTVALCLRSARERMHGPWTGEAVRAVLTAFVAGEDRAEEAGRAEPGSRR